MTKHGMRSLLPQLRLVVAVLLLAAPLRAFADTTHADSAPFALDTRIPASTGSGDSAVFVFDTRGNEWLNTLSTSTPFVLDTRNPSLSVPVVLWGRITDGNGVGLAGVTVSAVVGMTIVAQVTTDANGNYQLPPLSSVAYALIVTAPGYASTARVLTLSADGAAQNFQLTVLPAVPTLLSTNREPAAAFTQPPVGPMGSTLKVFDGAAFVAITPGSAPSPNRMTIVLTHGMNSDPTVWAQGMAAQMRASGVTTDIANILAWDWRTASEGSLPPEEHTPSQGTALGQALQAILGSSYSQPLHFIGHSLGTLVNAAAVNYLNGDRTGSAGQPVAFPPWSSAKMHLTVFDHAEVANLAGAQALFDGLTVGLTTAGTAGVLVYGSEVLQKWKPALPVHSVWADNYISDVGFYQPNAFNIALQKAVG